MLRKFFSSIVVVFVLSMTASVWAAPKAIAVKLHADYCGSCKAMAPAYSEVQRQFADKDVLFVTFDFTDEGTKHQSKLLAHALGLEKVFADNQKSGKVLLLEPKSKAIRGKLTKAHSAQVMGSVIDGVLSGKVMLEDAHKGSKSMKGSH